MIIFNALADLSAGSRKKVVVPYRDSVLTKLLQNALGNPFFKIILNYRVI